MVDLFINIGCLMLMLLAILLVPTLIYYIWREIKNDLNDKRGKEKCRATKQREKN